jgi:hypothetical protein
MQRILNIIHYCIYSLHYRFYLKFSRTVNLIAIIHRMPFIKRRYKQQGITVDDVQKASDEFFGDERAGLYQGVSSGFVMGGLAVLLFSILSIAGTLILNITISHYHIFTCMLAVVVITHYNIDREDIYIEYFREFKKWSQKELRTYTVYTLMTFLGVIALFFVALAIG